MQLNLDSLSVQYSGQARPAVRKVDLSLSAGAVGVLLGPSGCGKTTLLRAVAGLERISHGSITLQGQQISTPDYTLQPEKRHMGMVFQDYALFPHLDVQANVGFGLKSLSRSERQQRVAEMLELVGLQAMQQRYPHELSGGQQQRVALARALAPRPQLLLLDEPFSNLDAGLRDKLAHELRDMLKQVGTTALLVTHDQHEAFAMGDQIGVMQEGHLLQWADAATLYRQPVTPFVAQFIGHGMLLPAHCQDGRLHTSLGVLDACDAPSSTSQILLRAHDILPDPQSPIRGTILHKTFRGGHWLYALQLADGQELHAEMPATLAHAVGDQMGIRIQPHHLVVF